MSETVLVTGGAGFIGSHLVDALVKRGFNVRVLDNLDPQVHGDLTNKAKPPEYLNSKAHFIFGDVRDKRILEMAIEGVDIIFHQAAAVGVGQSMYQVHRYAEINSLGTANLLNILTNKKHRVRKIIVASSMSIYGEGSYMCKRDGTVYPRLRSIQQLEKGQWEINCPFCGDLVNPIPTNEEKPLSPTSIYAITKKDQEEMCLCIGRAYGIPTVALRYFNVYGPRQALSNPYTGVAAIFSARLLNNNSPLIFEDGRQSRDFVHVSDIVQANLLAMQSDGVYYDYFNIGTGRPTTVLEVAEVLCKVLNKEIKPIVVGKFREGDIRHCFADISKAKRVLGYTPRVSFEDGMRELTIWVKEMKAEDRVEKAIVELEQRGLVR